MAAVKSADVTGDDIVLENFEADKVIVLDSFEGMEPLCASKAVSEFTPTEKPTEKPTEQPASDSITVDFASLSEVPAYTADKGQGFVSKSDAIMPEAYRREVAPIDKIVLSAEGASITESDGAYLNNKNGNQYNYGGMIYRIDTGKPGAYHIEAELMGTAENTRVAPTGMDSGRLTGTSNWDNAGNVPRTVSASWSGSTWSYDFATGESFIELEIEPSKLPKADAPLTVGIKKITVTPLANNEKGEKPTIHILGDSTQKTYTFNETISAWGQTLRNYFDSEKVNVINYSMGGRAMKSNYNEGRTNEVLITGRPGDFVFIHSAHNDETVSNDRFERGASTGTDLSENNENYNRWLDMYVNAIKARGMTPVLVSAMPRTGAGRYSESAAKPNGFNPDSPGMMREKAASDEKVAFAELYAGAKAYIDKLDANEVMYIYNNTEAGETPANNAANGANSDGTHYKEAASKQWSRIILQSIYDQSAAAEDIYKDKPIMQELVSYMNGDVVEAAKSGDWSKVFPEMASDVSAVDVVKGAVKQDEENYYYRNNIEKALQLGLLHKDSNNLFKPTAAITVGEFARGIEKAFGLDENSLVSYTRTYDELTAEALNSAQTSETAYAELSEEISLPEEETNNEAAALAEGTCTVTVTQAEGGTVTVYNESAFHTATTDITAEAKANAVLADNEYYKLTAPSETVNKTDNNGVFANKDITTAAIELRNNGTKQIKYSAKTSGVVTMYLMFVDNKTITCENKTDGTSTQKYVNNTEVAGTTKANQYKAVEFNVEAGKEYELYTNGGTGRLFGIMYASTDYPQSTESLTVNIGDTVRVVARPMENYLNGAILIDGAQAAVTKEHKFVVNSDTEVSARFKAEPALKEETIIASDAALTREAMGAVLYDAYLMRMGKDAEGNWKKFDYMYQNGGVPSPDDPNYDPNIKYEGSPYIPLTGWGALADISELDSNLYSKVKEAYNLGLMRSETGIARGSIANGNKLEPKTVVTRAKAAKTLVFAFILTQPLSGESQTLPDGINHGGETADIAVPNEKAPSRPL